MTSGKDTATNTKGLPMPSPKLARLQDEAAKVAAEITSLRALEPADDAERTRIEERVRAVYAENCGMAFTTLVLVWAISAIVQALVIRWLNSRSET